MKLLKIPFLLFFVLPKWQFSYTTVRLALPSMKTPNSEVHLNLSLSIPQCLFLSGQSEDLLQNILPDHLLPWNLEGPFREHFTTACNTNSFNPKRRQWKSFNLLRSQYEPFQSLFKCSFQMNLYLFFQLLKNLPC